MLQEILSKNDSIKQQLGFKFIDHFSQANNLCNMQACIPQEKSGYNLPIQVYFRLPTSIQRPYVTAVLFTPSGRAAAMPLLGGSWPLVAGQVGSTVPAASSLVVQGSDFEILP